MVMPADDAPRPRRKWPGLLFTLGVLVLGPFRAKPAGAAGGGVPHLEPKHDPEFIARWSENADGFAQTAACERSCPCPHCRLTLFASVINEHVCNLIVAAAHSGDVSDLQAFLDLIERQKAT